MACRKHERLIMKGIRVLGNDQERSRDRGMKKRCSVDLCSSMLCAILFLMQLASAALPPDKFLGIAPEDLKHYRSNPIWCKDKSKSFPLSRLNDNFCDCPDGTDEPGTSACPEGKFYCKNVGHSPQYLFSSRVNDGICDCCDGSDEYDGKSKCADTCWEAGKKSRDKLEKKVSVFKEGSRLRAKDIQYSKDLRKKQESELADLKKEHMHIKDITQKLKAQVDAIEEMEKLEREKKAKEEEERKAKEEEERKLHGKSSNGETTVDEASADGKKLEEIQSTEEHSADEHEMPQVKEPDQVREIEQVKEHNLAPEIEKEVEPEHHHLEESEEMEGLSKEELGRRIASRWTGESVDTDTKQESTIDQAVEENDEDEPDEHLREEDEHEYEGEDDNANDHSYESDSDASDASESTDVSWWQKLRQAPRVLFNLLGLKRMHVDISEAERIRSDYRQANSKLNDLQSKISDLEKRFKQDFGKEGEFYSLYDHCFERRQQKYKYKICLYKDSTQEEGHSTTRLGTWEGFEDNYKTFKFQNGDHCWNGPQRSLKVRFRCGLKSELSDVEEPSRCEYSASLWTPAVCYEERVKELQAELDKVRAGMPTSEHEEL